MKAFDDATIDTAFRLGINYERHKIIRMMADDPEVKVKAAQSMEMIEMCVEMMKDDPEKSVRFIVRQFEAGTL